LKSETQRLWYVRLAEQVRGPFPSAAVAQDLALGRLPADAELSTDLVSWARAADLEAFSGLLQADQSDSWAEERRQALRRWADERDGQERRAAPGESGARRAGGERRHGDTNQRSTAPLAIRVGQGRGWLAIASLVALLLGLLVLAWVLGPGNAPEIKLLK
jgi:hypothetical protein